MQAPKYAESRQHIIRVAQLTRNAAAVPSLGVRQLVYPELRRAAAFPSATPKTSKLDAAPHLRHHHSVETKCAQCGAAMTCQPEGGCWCAELPKIPMPADAQACLCANCLRAKIAAIEKSTEKRKA